MFVRGSQRRTRVEDSQGNIYLQSPARLYSKCNFLTQILRLIQETRSKGAGFYGRRFDRAPTKTRVCRCFTQATSECQVFNGTKSRHDANSRSLRAENLPSQVLRGNLTIPPTVVWKVKIKIKSATVYCSAVTAL